MSVLDHPPTATTHLPAGTYPVNLDLNRRPCLVVGAGPVAAGKAAGLVAAGAAVTIVAPWVSPAARALVDSARPAVSLQQRRYRSGEAADHWLAITATNDPATNHQVFADCEAAGIWCNSADDLDNCSFILPAIVRRDQVQVSISSTGRSPAVASWLKRRIDDVLSPHIGLLAEAAAEARSRIRDRFGSTEAVDWASTLDGHSGHLLDLLSTGRYQEAVDLLLDELAPGIGSTAADPGLRGARR